MQRDERLLELADLAEGQWGLFTAGQARSVGISAQQLKRIADRNLVVRTRHGVYHLAGLPDSARDDLRSEWLALEPQRLAEDRIGDEVPVGVVSHRSAADLHGFGDIDADTYEFTVPRRRGTRSADVRFHVARLERSDWQFVGGLPVTRPLRTVVDLAAARIDGGHLATIARDAILSNGTTFDELADALRPFAHHYGAPIGAGAELLRTFIAQAGVPDSAISLAEAVEPDALSPVAPGVAEFGDAIDKLVAGGAYAELVARTEAAGPAIVEHVQAVARQLASPELQRALQAAARQLKSPEIQRTVQDAAQQLSSPETQRALQAAARQLESPAVQRAAQDAARGFRQVDPKLLSEARRIQKLLNP